MSTDGLGDSESGGRIKDGAAAANALKQLFPALFAGSPKPIKLKVQADIEERVPGKFTRQALTAFFRRHTATTAYLQAILRATHRFDLDGQPAGELSAEHKAAAQAALADRRERQRAREADLEAARRWRADLLSDWQRTSLSRANFCALKGVTDEALDVLLEQAKLEVTNSAGSTKPTQPRNRPKRPAGKSDRPAPR